MLKTKFSCFFLFVNLTSLTTLWLWVISAQVHVYHSAIRISELLKLLLFQLAVSEPHFKGIPFQIFFFSENNLIVQFRLWCFSIREVEKVLFDLFTCMLAFFFPLPKHTTEILLLVLLPFCLVEEINECWLRESVLGAAGIWPDIYFL